ncbi:MAG TPA: ABC-F family ATP-binding cassette domain-containing protein [Pseudomonadales bacterium]|jgi:ATPase subunit of ABC transporter with duplicated ATPase domains|nr:ABC-F family ATP-binding cassette domain-containing protein [Pseudomonadales bacterium]MDP6317104.1 ABC-F family ATP-binding cassette domain-containing protein [Pseudomonadales bacterium]MDP7316143.1 ABC-F family ATP-binding cassette domain-containing protein [Pseudomonadales bacterium]HJL60592.1 ABC-F family ATP-binding cassette domain-containing protein [Pseudomonadales bacterium]HJP50836.1 ABC-F family ATP-binding cassette domain-containing protein [Pseudomonadales bacterium]|tara:strand:- start:3016 stop:4737 length:1722 start_codon:yes stop_codon:yes gene_type:complete
MPPLLQCHRITHSAGTKPLFSSLDLSINEGDRIGLVGHNGSGKSTLFSIINNSSEPDDGDISRSRHLHIETVEQFIDPGLLELTLSQALAEKLPGEEKDFSHYKVEQLLTQLSFSMTEFKFKVSELSGGQQNRLMFARAVINNPNLILFDEPTNHLDLRTLLIFETFLCSVDASYILISHDRQFLDAVTDRTLFLRDQKIYNFMLPYTEAKHRLDEQDETAAARLKQEEKTIKGLQASAKRLALWGKVYDNEDIAAKAKSMEKRIKKLEENKTFVSKGSRLSLTLDMQSSRANRMMHIENQDVMSPGDNPIKLFHIDEFFIKPGDRVALLGHNGAGKTTLIKEMMNRYHNDKDGEYIKFNPQCDIGYYDQEIDGLDPGRSLTETLRDRCLRASENEHKTSLIKAGFPYLDLDKKVRVLSGGEKARLMFLIIKLNQPNFLILDEPTNHIDIQGKEELEQQILETNATVLITSHDRRFVDNIADRYVLIHQNKLIEINNPDWFYNLGPDSSEQIRENPASGIDQPVGDSEEAILNRILELETLLEEDLARKPKFQKPKLQMGWREELEALNGKLG